MKRNDITVSTTYDLVIDNGDFIVANSDDQNIDIILRSTKGSIRQYPSFGVGVDYLLNGKIDSTFKFLIVDSLKQDGYVAKVSFGANGQIDIKYNEYV